MVKQTTILILLFFGFLNCSNIQEDCSESVMERNMVKAQEALAYCKEKRMNTDFCVLIDMSVHSGKNRFFLWDFKEAKVIEEGLCSHGCGKAPWGDTQTMTKPVFSNVSESHMSSVGKYKIGERGVSQWGINVKYLLHGLEKTNSNAYKRFIVLHSWDAVAEEEVYPNGTPEGWGCPAVSNGFLRAIDGYLKGAEDAVLLWVYF